MDVLGRDDEVSSLQAFLDRPGDGGMAGIVLEGEAGIGKSTLWLAGVEAARLRGFHVLSSRPAEVELGVAYAGLGDLLEDARSGRWGTSWKRPVVVRSRPRCCSGRTQGRPVDFRTLAVAVRSALHVALRAPADPARGRRRPVAGYAVTNRPGVRVAAIAGREHPAAASPQAWGRHPRGPSFELALDSELIECRHVGPVSPGALHAILQAEARPVIRAADVAAHPRSGGRQPFLCSRARPRPRRQCRPDPAAAGPRDAGGARPGSPRWIAGRDTPSVVARLHAWPAGAAHSWTPTHSSPHSPTT